MRAKSLLAILLALVLGSSVAMADLASSATANVSINVVSNVAVSIANPLLLMGNVQTGPFSGTITFRVDANMQVIGLSVAVSNLYKDNAATSEFFIPVSLTPGVLVAPSIGNELPAGSDNKLEYVDTLIKVGPYDGVGTIVGTFGSGQNNHFSQEVLVTPTWNQIDPELPTGEYCGEVILTAVVI
jgi:hypothetical protein